MCTVLLPPGDNPIAVNKYINIKNVGGAFACLPPPLAPAQVTPDEVPHLRWLHGYMLELFYMFIRAVNDDVSHNNNAVQNLQTYGRLIFNMELCQETAVAHFLRYQSEIRLDLRAGEELLE